jgi:predicted transcriptional regulator YdeE
MDSQLRNIKAFTVMGIFGRQSNDNPEQIGKLWQEFYAKGGAKQIPNRRGDDVFAVYTDYEGDYTKPYMMLIGCEVPAGMTTPPGFEARVIQAGSYAVFEARGPIPASVVSTWQHVWKAPLQRAYSTDFDRYRGPEAVDVHVAVK